MTTEMELAQRALRDLPRERLATLPTPLEEGPKLQGGTQLLVKRDDLTGLGMGGNKARKLEMICASAKSSGADALVTVGAGQSNHARMTAAAGAVLGMESHLVLGGGSDSVAEGNQLLSRMFGAQLHFAGTDDWAELDGAMSDIVDELVALGKKPFRIPIGGSTAVGALGFVLAWEELMVQCAVKGISPSAIVHASSTGGTHAGLLAGASIWAQDGQAVPKILAVDVAKQQGDLAAETMQLAQAALEHLGLTKVRIAEETLSLEKGWGGGGYAIPSREGDEAATWAAQAGAWILDRVYTSKAFAFVLDGARRGRFQQEDSVVFWHTGGTPAVFANGGVELNDPTLDRKEYA